MATRLIPGSGAEFTPVFNDTYGVISFTINNGGSGYASTDPPKIEVSNTISPLREGSFYPIIAGGSITQISVLDSGEGYFPTRSSSDTRIGIKTSSFVETSKIVTKFDSNNNGYLSVASTESSIIMDVLGAEGTSIYENGYNVAISTNVTGVSAPVTPNFSFNQNRFYGFFDPFPSYYTSGLGTGSTYNAFIVYNSTTGDAISTSLVLRKGGNRYSDGDTVSISGTHFGGSTPANDLSFNVSNLANTRIGSEANQIYVGLAGSTLSGVGTGAIFTVSRDFQGDIDDISVDFGGVGYALTDSISIPGDLVGGVTPGDDVKLSPAILGRDDLPEEVYVQKVSDNGFRVTGLSTTEQLEITTYGIGTHSFTFDNPNSSGIILIDNIIQSPLYKRDLLKNLILPVGINTEVIYLSGISSLTSLDVIQIDSEFFKIKDVGLTSATSVEVVRGILGSEVGYHTVGAAVTIIRGDFNIVKDEIHFNTAPYGPVGPEGLKVNSSFTGRMFSRQIDPANENDKNIIFDDISTKFVGASSTEFFLENYGERVVGVYTDTNTVLTGGIDINNNPLVLINNVPQISGTDFEVDKDDLQPDKGNRLKFLTGTPGAGKISATMITPGLGYQPLISAGATAIISAAGTISNVVIGGYGSGYKFAPSIEIYSNIGSGSSLSASINSLGVVTSVTIVNPGSGYTQTSPPILVFEEPTNYNDLDLEFVPGISTGNGSGAKASVVIGQKGDVIQFEMEQPGLYYKSGDVLYVPGLIANSGITTISVTNLVYDHITGISTITTASDHGFAPDDYVKLSGVIMDCDSWAGIGTYSIIDFQYDKESGITTITTDVDHYIPVGDYVKLRDIELSCNNLHSGITSTIFPYPAGTNTYGDAYPQSSQNTLQGTYDVFRTIGGTSANKIVFDAGISTITHSYTPGAFLQQIVPTDANYDTATGEFTIVSVAHTVTTGQRVKLETEGFVFTCTMDGNATEHSLPESDQYAAGRHLPVVGVTTDSFTVNVGTSGTNLYFTPTNVTYDTSDGDLVLTIGTHSLTVGEGIKIVPNSLSFTCTMDGNQSTKTYPRTGIDPYASRSIPIKSVTNTTITLNVGASSQNKEFTPTDADYDPLTGELSLNVGQHGLGVGRNVIIEDNSFTFTCALDGNSTQHTYPRPGQDPYAGKKSIEITSVGFTSHTATDAPYDAATGLVNIEVVGHGFNNGDYVLIEDASLTYSCALDGHSQWKNYPRSNYDYPSGRWLKISNVTTDTFDINVGESSYTGIHTFVSATANGIKHQDGTFVLNVGTGGTDTSVHTFVGVSTGAVKHLPQSAHTFVSAATSAIQHLPQSVHSFVRTTPNAVSIYEGNGSAIVGITTNVFPYPGGSYNTIEGTYDIFTSLQGTSGNTIVLNTGISTIAHTYDFGGDITKYAPKRFTITVDKTLTDKFSGFYPGQFIQFDDVSRFFNGFKRKFTLTVTEGSITEILSLKTKKESDLRMENNLFVFINDVLQEPVYSYTWNGSRIIFKEAPIPNSKCTILFYRGSDLDVIQIDPPKTIKIGDDVKIGENRLDPVDRPQFERIVKRIVSSDALDTFSYDSLGINTDTTKQRPLDWTKQTQDKIINGVLYSKSRPNLLSSAVPITKLITNLNKSDREIYVNNAFPLFSEIDNLPENISNVKIIDKGIIEPALVDANVSTNGNIDSLTLTDGGQGFRNITNPNIVISSSAIIRRDPIYNWVGTAITGISTSNTLNSLTIGEPIVAVGQSSIIGISTNGMDWSESVIGYGGTINFNSVAVGGTDRFVTVGENAKALFATGNNDSISSWNEFRLFREVIVFGQTVPQIKLSTYDDTFNAALYSEQINSWVVVGENRGLFVGAGIGATTLLEKNPSSFGGLKAIAFNNIFTIAVGDDASILYTNDGIVWQRVLSIPSTKTLHDIIWDGNKFIVVGDQGTILYSTSGSVNWLKFPASISVDLIKIRYEYGVYILLDAAGVLYYSLDLINWVQRDTKTGSNQPKDLQFIPAPPPPGVPGYISPIETSLGRFVLVGSGGTTVYAEPVYNRATGVATVTNGSVSSVSLVNTGFGYTAQNTPPVLVESDRGKSEDLFSIKAEGDFGYITNIGVGVSHIDFVLESETYDNSSLGIGYSSLNAFGVNYSEIQVGDYFVITESNSIAGHALTGITTYLGGLNNYPDSKVGTAVSYIDGVYRAEKVFGPVSGIVTVRCMFTYSATNGPIQVNTFNNTNGIYGRYSWGKIYDYQNRLRFGPEDFIVNTDNGLVGLSTAPEIYRTRAVK
jgi:hypothetical protein